MQAEDILHFWFEELSPAQHFAQEDAIDAMIRVRFGPIWQAAQHCELWEWRATPQGRLAEIVVLDQFSRHIHRGTPLAFAQDAQALVLAQELVAGGHDATHGKGPINRWWADRLGQHRLWLHAWQLTIPHPETGAALVFDSGLQLPAWNPSRAEAASAALPANDAQAPTADWQRLLARLPWHASPGAR